MSSLTLYSYNSKRIDETCQNVVFLFNSKQILKSSKKASGIQGLNIKIQITGGETKSKPNS